MTSFQGVRLSEIIREKLGQLVRLCTGIDEMTASRSPSGRWPPKEILSHLLGVEGKGLLSLVGRVLEEETPKLDLESADPFYTERRRQMTFSDLLAEVKKEYEGTAELVARLPEEDLARTAYIPMFKETPIGEYPTLGTFVEVMAKHHIDFHIIHLKEILKALRTDGTEV